VLETISSLSPGASIVTLEHQVLAPDKKLCWHRWTNRAIFDDQNNLFEYQAVGWDITERKQTEEALRESEERYKSLFKNNHSVMLLIDPESANIVDANPAAISFYGWSHEELTRKKISDINTLAEKQVFQEMEKAKSEQRSHFTFRHRLSNGDIRDVEVFSGPIILHGRKLLYSIIHDVTERKQAEMVIEKFFEQPMNLHIIAGFDGLINRVNMGWQIILGYSKNEVEGTIFFDLVHPEDQASTIEEMKKLGKGESTSYFENRYRHKNGNYRLLAWSAIASLKEQLVYAVASDITEAKRAKEGLRESEERFKDLANLLPQPVWETDFEGNFTYTNRAGYENLGYTPKDLEEGVFITDVIAPEDRERIVANFGKTLRGIEFEDHEYTCITKDGRKVPALIYSSPIIKDGEPSGIRGVALDITDRKQAEDALRESEEQYRDVFENVSDFLYLHDLEGYFINVNSAFKNEAGYSDEEISDLNVIDLLPESYKHLAEDYFKRVMEGGRDEGLMRVRTKDGRELIVEYKNSLIDYQKQPIGVRGSARDITKRRQAEEALKEREVELERKNLRLGELNSALKILLEKRDEDKKVLEENVLTNMKELVLPYVVKLKKTTLNDRQEIFLEIIQSNIEDILSPFAYKLSYKYLNFTPTELQVAYLVKQGLRTKEIADLLNSSPETISGHRKSMRKKLNLKDKKSNLRTHLLSLNNG
jgi:PAS domain S-box-containing protein